MAKGKIKNPMEVWVFADHESIGSLPQDVGKCHEPGADGELTPTSLDPMSFQSVTLTYAPSKFSLTGAYMRNMQSIETIETTPRPIRMTEPLFLVYFILIV